MAFPNQIFYDRVAIYLNNVAYMPLGQIRNFSMTITYKNTQQAGFTPDGWPAGRVFGNKMVDRLEFEEYLPIGTDFLNWNEYILANPNSSLVVQPISIANNIPTAPTFTVLGLLVANIGIVSQLDDVTKRTCTFNASYTNIG